MKFPRETCHVGTYRVNTCETRPHLLRFRADYHIQDEACEHQVKPDIARDTHVKVCDNQRARGKIIEHTSPHVEGLGSVFARWALSFSLLLLALEGTYYRVPRMTIRHEN